MGGFGDVILVCIYFSEERKKKTGEAVKSHLKEEHNFRNTGSGENCF